MSSEPCWPSHPPKGISPNRVGGASAAFVLTSSGESMARMSASEVLASTSTTSLTFTDLGPSSAGRT